jgi:fucose permease
MTLASAGFVSLGLPEGLLGVAWPSIRESFGLNLDALGMLLATFAAGYFVASALNGRVLARVGVGVVLAVSCTLMGLSLIGYSLAPSWPTMVALGAAAGAGGGTIDAALNVFATAHGARYLNWLHAAFGFGAAIGPLVMTAILSSGRDWSVGYLSVGIAQLFLAVGYWLLRHRFGGPTAPATAQAVNPTALIRQPLAWLSVAMFFVYVGIEIGAGQWTYSLFTLERGVPAAVAGVWLSVYWASLTIGRLVFGVIVSHVSIHGLLRACMLMVLVGAVLIWVNVPFGLAVLGAMLAPIFPSAIATTPERVEARYTADLVGIQIAAAVLGGAVLPGMLGVLATRASLEVIGPCLVLFSVALLLLHEAVVRLSPVYAPRKSARSQSDVVASSQPRA